MALSKQQKEVVVSEIADLLGSSKLTVIAKYKGLSVKNMQTLRKDAKESQTIVKVVKNRLVKQAIAQVDSLKQVDTSQLVDQLVYAFNSSDEVAPAKALSDFAKKEPALQFVGAITDEGILMSADDVIALASLPNKEQLRGQLVGTIAAPLTAFVRVVQGGQRSLIYALNARAEQLN